MHAGGDSKRVPWANPIGKAFIPAPIGPYMDPDEHPPLLLDHILAISAPIAANMPQGLLPPFPLFPPSILFPLLYFPLTHSFPPFSP